MKYVIMFFVSLKSIVIVPSSFLNVALPAQCGVILNPLNLILKLLNPTKDMHMLLLQHTEPQFIPE